VATITRLCERYNEVLT